MGVLLCCHGAQRSGLYQSISYQSIKVKGGTDEGDSAALAFQSERSGQGRRHEGMTRGDRAVAEACRRAMETEAWKELVILESVGVRFTGLVGRFVSEIAMPVLQVMHGDSFHQGAAAQLTHMVKTRDGGETIRIIKTLAVKGRF